MPGRVEAISSRARPSFGENVFHIRVCSIDRALHSAQHGCIVVFSFNWHQENGLGRMVFATDRLARVCSRFWPEHDEKPLIIGGVQYHPLSPGSLKKRSSPKFGRHSDERCVASIFAQPMVDGEPSDHSQAGVKYQAAFYAPNGGDGVCAIALWPPYLAAVHLR